MIKNIHSILQSKPFLEFWLQYSFREFVKEVGFWFWRTKCKCFRITNTFKIQKRPLSNSISLIWMWGYLPIHSSLNIELHEGKDPCIVAHRRPVPWSTDRLLGPWLWVRLVFVFLLATTKSQMMRHPQWGVVSRETFWMSWVLTFKLHKTRHIAYIYNHN